MGVADPLPRPLIELAPRDLLAPLDLLAPVDMNVFVPFELHLFLFTLWSHLTHCAFQK